MVDNWKIFISSSKHWRHFIMLLYCQSFSFYGKCSVKILTVTSSLEHHHLELCGNYKQKCPIRWILFLEAPQSCCRIAALAPTAFYFTKSRQDSPETYERTMHFKMNVVEHSNFEILTLKNARQTFWFFFLEAAMVLGSESLI